MGTQKDINKASLLWPCEQSKRSAESKDFLKQDSYIDIDLEDVVSQYGLSGENEGFIRSIFANMCEDIEVINYRLDTIDNILNCKEVEDSLESLLNIAIEADNYSRSESVSTPDVQKLIKSFRETDLFGRCIYKAREIMLKSGGKYVSEGLHRLRDEIIELSENYTYNDEDIIGDGEDEYVKAASITLGINLDHDFRPTEATVISVNDHKFTKAPFLNRLIRSNKSKFEGAYDFHSSEENGISKEIINELEKSGESLVEVDSTALQLCLMSDLDRMIKRTTIPLQRIIRRYMNAYMEFFVNLKYELMFFLGSVRIIKNIRNMGMPMVRPKAEKKEKRVCSLEGFYNINLAFRFDKDASGKIVKNDLDFTSSGNIYILTGPNSGGKTTYIRGISIIQVLFQAGLYVPADKACISPVDNIYTHFSSEEKRDTDYGRLGEEAKRLNSIFKEATKYSLVILNESLASTSPTECLYMSRDIVYGLKLLDARAIFATHMHELAVGLEKVNSTRRGNGIIRSLIAGSRKQRNDIGEGFTIRTYKVVEAPPQGISYAKDVAELFGISYEKIEKIIDERSKK